jgi:endonuclease/exonuclease/phosphatase family metal-dependent hydrolase
MRIRVGTLNAWGLPEPLGRDVSARIEAIGQRLPSLHLDVIAFQEVWTSDAARRLREAGRRAGLPHSWFDEGTFGARTVGGLLVLSRFPIDRVDFERFALRGEPKRVVADLEYLSGKGFAMVRLETPEGPLTVVDTHLHARYGGYASHEHVPHRTTQAVQLAARLFDHPEPLLAVGDFNFLEGEIDYRVLTDILGLEDVAVRLGKRFNTTLHSNPYRKPTGIDKRKDYVFARSGAERTLIPRRIELCFDDVLDFEGERASYSNHAGLVATLELAAGPPTARPDPPSWVFDVAADAIQEGERLAEAGRRDDRWASGIGLGLAAAAVLGAAPRRMSRRRVLRGFLAAGGLVALTPGVGLTIATEVFLPDEIAAFRRAADQLARLRDPQQVAGSAGADASI